jgi:hypothetical protein
MCIIAEGAGADVDEEGSPDVVAEPDLSFREGLLAFLEDSSLCCLPWFESGVDAALSSAGAPSASVIVMSAEADFEAESAAPAGASSEENAVPVLARLCCLWVSLSEGERDRLRLESASGMANLVHSKF